MLTDSFWPVSQIRHAVMKGVIPQQMLNPQLMTPRHLNLLQQLVMKTTERQQLIQRMNVINKVGYQVDFSFKSVTNLVNLNCFILNHN